MRFVAILLVLLSCSAVSHAQSMTSRLAKIDDTAALNAAVTDIGKLSSRQAEALAQAMANCWDGLAARGATDRAFEECARSHRYFTLHHRRRSAAPPNVQLVVRRVRGEGSEGQQAAGAMLIGIEQAFSAAIRKRFDVLDQEHK